MSLINILSAAPHCFIYYIFILLLEIGKYMSSKFFFFYKYDQAILDLLHFHMCFQNGLSISTKKHIGIFYELHCIS